MEELGRPVGRGEVYLDTHVNKDGGYANEESRTVGVSSYILKVISFEFFLISLSMPPLQLLDDI